MQYISYIKLPNPNLYPIIIPKVETKHSNTSILYDKVGEIIKSTNCTISLIQYCNYKCNHIIIITNMFNHSYDTQKLLHTNMY